MIDMTPRYHRIALYVPGLPEKVMIFNDASKAARRMAELARDAQLDVNTDPEVLSFTAGDTFVEVVAKPNKDSPDVVISWRAELELDLPYDQ